MGRLADLVADARADVRRVRTCAVARALDGLDAADAGDLRKLLADEAVPSPALVKALAALGFPMAASTLRTHRRGECACASAS